MTVTDPRSPLAQRYRELDALRALAVLAMVIYHFAFDAAFLYDWRIDVQAGAWAMLGKSSATLFLLLVGCCFVIAWERTPTGERLLRSLKRSGILLTGGLIVSAATWLIAPDEYVRFGILHLIGLSALLLPFFRPLRLWNAACGACITFLSGLIPLSTGNSTLLTILGGNALPPPALDYYPLLPWLGIILIGMAIGDLLYVPSRKSSLAVLDRIPYPRPFLTIGRRALLVYFLHQPVLLGVLAACFGLPVR